MKKIIVISNTSFSIEKFRLHYLSKIDEYLFKIYTPKDNLRIKSKFKNIKHLQFTAKNIISAFFNIYAILKIEKPKTVIVYSTYYIFILSILKFIFNYKLITVVAGRGSLFFEIHALKEKFLKGIFKFFLNFSNKIIFINPGDLEYFSNNSIIKNKSFLLPTEGVKKINFLKKKNKKKNFIFFARLINEKGILDYINLAKKIKRKYPYCKFYIAGPISKSVIGQSSFSSIEDLLYKNRFYIKFI